MKQFTQLTEERTCQCGRKYTARKADLKRGWGLSCSKTCAAIRRTHRERRGNFNIAAATKKYQPHRLPSQESIHQEAMDAVESGWDGHKDQW